VNLYFIGDRIGTLRLVGTDEHAAEALLPQVTAMYPHLAPFNIECIKDEPDVADELRKMMRNLPASLAAEQLLDAPLLQYVPMNDSE
jgi:hypothetical protein